MTCIHLQEMFQLCKDNELRISSADLVHIVCKQCQKDEVCPTLLLEQYESRHPEQQLDSETNTASPDIKEVKQDGYRCERKI